MMDSTSLVIWGAVFLFGVVMLVGIFRHEKRKRLGEHRIRGREPGQGDTVISADLGSGVGGHSTVYRVPKDDQAYAKGMMPSRRK